LIHKNIPDEKTGIPCVFLLLTFLVNPAIFRKACTPLTAPPAGSDTTRVSDIKQK
jgi:hypothetical protein